MGNFVEISSFEIVALFFVFGIFNYILLKCSMRINDEWVRMRKDV
jgi:hypothetical protein